MLILDNKSLITCNSEFITINNPDRFSYSANWNQLVKVSVITTDKGPFEDDVAILIKFTGEKNDVLVPSECKHYNKIFECVSNLKGFNYDNYIKAMSYCFNNEFVCWERTY